MSGTRVSEFRLLAARSLAGDTSGSPAGTGRGCGSRQASSPTPASVEGAGLCSRSGPTPSWNPARIIKPSTSTGARLRAFAKSCSRSTVGSVEPDYHLDTVTWLYRSAYWPFTSDIRCRRLAWSIRTCHHPAERSPDRRASTCLPVRLWTTWRHALLSLCFLYQGLAWVFPSNRIIRAWNHRCK